jgi:adenylyltransferase/sulfurtransferase
MTSERPDSVVKIQVGRFERFARVDWWDQQRLERAKVLVVGAGALGNEVVKNLSLVGVGRLAIADMDRIEESNLSRSALFSPQDEGKYKAEVLAQSARRLWPKIDAIPLVGNVLGDIGLGWFRWADIVVGALDNREARVYVNSTCASLGRTWIDGGIDMLNGVVRGFSPPDHACYECTMNQTDWDLLNKRRSCSLLARRAMDAGGAPTSPTTASIIGAMQAQEVIKFLHGMDIFSGSGFIFEGRTHQSYSVDYPIKSDCPWHEPAPSVASTQLGRDSLLSEVWDVASKSLGTLDAIDLSREVVTSLTCTSCENRTSIFRPIHAVTEHQAVCAKCGIERRADIAVSVAADSGWLERSVSEFGIPDWDIVWARSGMNVIGIELAGDKATWMGEDGGSQKSSQ